MLLLVPSLLNCAILSVSASRPHDNHTSTGASGVVAATVIHPAGAEGNLPLDLHREIGFWREIDFRQEDDLQREDDLW